MSHVERMLEFADLPKQMESYWWATKNLNQSHHSGAYWVLRILQKSGKTELLRNRTSKFLIDKGYDEEVSAAES